MKPWFPPGYYSDKDVFAREELALFRGLWQFAALADELTEENDFVTRNIGGRAVFVQRLEGQLRCFENLCSHRFSRLHAGRCGNARIRCPYHGWMYNAEGFPCTIPHRPRFDDVNEETIRSLRLPVWQIAQCGNLIFVREGETGCSLREYLGGIYDDLEEMSLAFGPRIDTNEILINANWKIVVENTLEGYHVDFVHADTFKRLGATTGSDTWQWNLPHSRYYSRLGDRFDADCSRLKSLFASRPWSCDGYLHQFAFPNLTLATTYGTSFSLQHFEPVGPEQTRFTSYVFQSRLTEPVTGVRKVMVESVNQSVVSFNRQVFEEDRSVCEYVHQGARQTRGTGLLSDEEFRVSEFQRTVLTALNEPAQLLSMTSRYGCSSQGQAPLVADRTAGTQQNAA